MPAMYIFSNPSSLGDRKSPDYQLTDTSPDSLFMLTNVLVRFMVRLSVEFVITLLL